MFTQHNSPKPHIKFLSSSSSSTTLVPFLLIDVLYTFMANVVELKVGLHCEECIKKILKAIKKMEGIDTYDVDVELNKVIVTGNVRSEEVIRVLQKIGKQASNWGEEEANLGRV